MIDYPKQIIKQLEHISGHGFDRYQVFTDFLEMSYVTLERLPEHLRAAVEKKPLTDTPEGQKVFENLKKKYTKETEWDYFRAAFRLLLDSGQEGIELGEFKDIIGMVFMQYEVSNSKTGQFFTPWSLCVAIAQMMVSPDDVYEKLRTAYLKSKYGVMHGFLKENEGGEPVSLEFIREMGMGIFDLIDPHDIEPLTICDPCCGSGGLLLAAAQRFPLWMLHFGLVRFSAIDIDYRCVRMCQINAMLYGLNGFSAKCANALFPDDLDKLPKDYKEKYTEAKEKPENIPDIENEVRAWKQERLI